MQKLRSNGLRIVGLALMALVTTHCGDSNVNVIGGGNIDPTPGTFTGTTSQGGGQIFLLAGSVESATLICNGQTFGGACDPVLQVVNSTAIGTCNGLSIDVTFNSDDQARINDIAAGTSCDGSGNVERLDGPTPTFTPGGPTPTVTVTPTSSDTTPTETPTGDLSPVTPTPTMTPCPTLLTIEGQGAQAVLNTGWTGLAFDQTVIERGTLTVAISNCNPGTPGNCGLCDVDGPVASNTAIDNKRCLDDTSMTCTAASDCPSGDCEFLFGSYLPLASGGIGVCVRNVVNGAITGTADIEGGSGASVTNLTSQVFTGVETAAPCPICSGSGFLSTGTCMAGDRNGESCTVHGVSGTFGNTSYDCPPNPGGNIGNIQISLNPTTGMTTLDPTEMCDTFPFAGAACYCPGQDKANNCTSGICEGTDSAGLGTCAMGPFVGFCRPADPFRTCLSDGDCPTSDDACVFEAQPCQGPQANAPDLDITGPLKLTGSESTNNPTLVASFCTAAVASGAVNAAAGLPGPGTLFLPSKTCFTDDAGTCQF